MSNGSGTLQLDFGVIDIAILLLIIGFVAGRLLGVKRGFWRSLFAGLIGLAAGFGLVYAQFGDLDNIDSLSDLASLGIGFLGYVLLVTMVASIVIEAILRPKERKRRRGIPRPDRWISSKFALLQRLWQIFSAARRHGLVGRRLSRSGLSTPEGARALRLTLEDCGGMFVKFGQIASGRDDILPVTITSELAELRTAVKPLPPETVREIMIAELGEDFAAEFESFDYEALAAASVGVTHRATMKNGQPVIVKVQRPFIDDIVERDGRVLLWGATQLERRSESARSLGIVDLCQELINGVTEELDFTREARNNEAMRRSANDVEGVDFPNVYNRLTTRRVLVMELVRGEPVSDAEAVDATGIPRKELADRLLRSFLDQVLRDGVYHADPHAGNILIDTGGTMWFIDFGAVGHLDPITMEALQQMAIGFTLTDPGILARAVRRLAGSQGLELDISGLEYDMGTVLTQVEGGGFGPAAIAEVLHVLRRHKVKAPRALTIMGRAAVTMEGTLRQVSPHYSMSREAQGLVKTEPTADTAQEIAKDELLRALPSLRPLPQITEDVALLLRAGRIGFQIERFGEHDAAHIDRWLDRILWAMVGMIGLLGSAILLGASMVQPDNPASVYMRIIGFVGLVVSSAMQMRTVARVLQRRDPRDVG